MLWSTLPFMFIFAVIQNEKYFIKCTAQGNWQNIKVQVLMAYWQLKYPRDWSHGKGHRRFLLTLWGILLRRWSATPLSLPWACRCLITLHLHYFGINGPLLIGRMTKPFCPKLMILIPLTEFAFIILIKFYHADPFI